MHLSDSKPDLWKKLTKYFRFHEDHEPQCLDGTTYHYLKNVELNIALEISIFGNGDCFIEVDCVNPSDDWEGDEYEELYLANQAGTVPEIIAALEKIKQSKTVTQTKIIEEIKTIKPTKKETTMTAVNIIKSSNLSSAAIAAKITIGKTANKIIMSKVKPMLPYLARGYAEHPLATVLIANAANLVVKSRYQDNKKAVYIAEALMDASMLTLIEEFNIDEVICNFIENIKIPAALKSEINEE